MRGAGHGRRRAEQGPASVLNPAFFCACMSGSDARRRYGRSHARSRRRARPAFRAHDQASVDEQILAAGDEGVQRRVVQNVDVDRIRIEPGRGEDRIGDLLMTVSVSASRIRPAA